MKKVVGLILFLLVFASLAFAGPTGPFPNKEFGQDLGKDGRSYNDLYLKNSIYFEGATSDSYETKVYVTEPTADRTITIPNETGTVITTGTTNTDGIMFIPASRFYTLYAGTTPWSRSMIRNAAGDWAVRQTSGNNDNTMQLSVSLDGFARRSTASKGIKITGFKVAHKVATQARGAGTVTFKKVIYADGVANAITDLPVTGTLATATSTNNALDTFTVTTPVYLVDENANFVIDIAVAATTSGCVWDVYGIYVTYQNSY